jgi:hypothetical protein
MPFRPGHSGNPAGKPKGPHKTTRDLRKIVNAATPAFARQVIRQAKAGDPASQALFARHDQPGAVGDRGAEDRD